MPLCAYPFLRWSPDTEGARVPLGAQVPTPTQYILSDQIQPDRQVKEEIRRRRS